MGTTTSKPAKKRTKEQQDIKNLGKIVSFGDEELLRLYRTHNNVEALSDDYRKSFLVDYGIQTMIVQQELQNQQKSKKLQLSDTGTQLQSQQPSEEEKEQEKRQEEKKKEERLLLIQILEQKILPNNFGNHLYETTLIEKGIFVSPYKKTSLENTCASTIFTTVNNNNVEDDTRLTRLEKFVYGISCCGRRGNRAAVGVLLECCEQIATEEKQSNSFDNPITYDGGSNSNSNNSNLIRASEFVNIGYRIALACAFLEAAKRDDGDISMYIPPAETIGDDGNDENKTTKQSKNQLRNQQIILNAVTGSIITFAKERKTRLGIIPTQKNTEEQGLVTKNDIFDWTDDIAPLYGSILSTFIYHLFFPDRKFPPSQTPFDYPRIPNDSAFFSYQPSPLLFALGSLSLSLGGTFFRLYTSLSDGLSFNRLLNALHGYSGPTLLIIREIDGGGVFGAFTSSPWKENKDFYGNSDCFLFQLLPTFAIYRPSGNGTNYMYCNSEARSRGYDQQAHGIGFGGTVHEPRLFISETFDNNVASNRDMTYQNGPMLPKPKSGNSSLDFGGSSNKSFDIDSLEVWGVGGEEVVMESLNKRSKARDVKDANIRKAKKVDKAAFLDDFRSGIVESKAFNHLQQVQGSANDDIDELRARQQRGRELHNST